MPNIDPLNPLTGADIFQSSTDKGATDVQHRRQLVASFVAIKYVAMPAKTIYTAKRIPVNCQRVAG